MSSSDSGNPQGGYTRHDDTSGLGAQQYGNTDTTGSALSTGDGRGDGGYGGTSVGGDTLGGDKTSDSRGGGAPSVTYSGGGGGGATGQGEQTGAQAKLGENIDKYDSDKPGAIGQGRQEYGMGSGRTQAQEEGGVGGEIGSTEGSSDSTKKESKTGKLMDKAKSVLGSNK